ncbi:AlpA family transcriptional regulator [Streptomyces sp. NBC_00078]|uniref:helix-turn-helix transcriptional regulator n=1 Tax=unclassified Streptomyces TaxID=2593676 RepID=UPI002259FA65|nr:DNA-binding protein [Streptomyces sp. NBC_00078]MCX5419948.1 DNA-binding protein [Streptomyces sp. NBC_00078]
MQTSVRKKVAPTLAEVKDWPATISAEQCARALGISRAHIYELLKQGACPVKFLALGSGRKVFLTASLVRVLSGEPDPQPPAPVSALVAA